MAVPCFGGLNEGGWAQGDIDVYLQAAEYGGTVHSYSPHSVPITGYGEEARIEFTEAVVGCH